MKMNNNDAVFEHIISQLREHFRLTNGDKYQKALEVWHEKTEWIQGDKRFDVLKPSGKHRADVMREYITRQEAEVQSLKNQLRDSSEQIKDLHDTIELMNEDFKRATYNGMPEQAGCRKDDTQVEEPWIKWEGGVRPVPLGTLIEVKFREGSTTKDKAGTFSWWANGLAADIIRYRVARDTVARLTIKN